MSTIFYAQALSGPTQICDNNGGMNYTVTSDGGSGNLIVIFVDEGFIGNGTVSCSTCAPGDLTVDNNNKITLVHVLSSPANINFTVFWN